MKHYGGGVSEGEGVTDTPLSEADVAEWVPQCSVVGKSTALEPDCLVLTPVNHCLAVRL